MTARAPPRPKLSPCPAAPPPPTHTTSAHARYDPHSPHRPASHSARAAPALLRAALPPRPCCQCQLQAAVYIANPFFHARRHSPKQPHARAPSKTSTCTRSSARSSARGTRRAWRRGGSCDCVSLQQLSAFIPLSSQSKAEQISANFGCPERNNALLRIRGSARAAAEIGWGDRVASGARGEARAPRAGREGGAA